VFIILSATIRQWRQTNNQPALPAIAAPGNCAAVCFLAEQDNSIQLRPRVTQETYITLADM
jgi:hypothetical protein